MSIPTSGASLLLVYRGQEPSTGRSRWSLQSEDEIESSVHDPGAATFQYLAGRLLRGAELRAATGYEQELVVLLREAAADQSWDVSGPDGSPIPLGEGDEHFLSTVADTYDSQGFVPAVSPRSVAPDLPWDDAEHMVIPSPSHYAALQQALASGSFERVDGSPFPRAVLTRGSSQGFAELRPVTPEHEALLTPEEIDALARQMWQKREELSDHDADTLDTVSAAWIHRARGPSDRIPIYVDDLLRARGLRPKKSGTGRRGGFEPEQRAGLWRCLLHLQDLWLDIAEAQVVEKDSRGRRRRRTRTLQSRAFVMTDRIGQKRLDGSMDVEAILVSPGEAFGRFLLGPGRQVALLSSKALQYDPFRQTVEKRLARYLSWQWRIGAHKAEFLRGYRVSTLLEEIHLETNERQPSRTRDRLEKGLDCLQSDGVISGWQYAPTWDEEGLPRQGWLSLWLETRIDIEAPESIKSAYKSLDQRPEQKTLKSAKPPATHASGTQLRTRRQELGLTQLQAGEQIGISQAYVAQIEGGRKPSARVLQKLDSWLQTTTGSRK